MRITKIVYVVVALAIALFVLSGCAMLGSQETKSAALLLKEANAKAVEAQKTSGSVPQSEKFTDAIKLYQRVDKKDPKSAEAAEALLAAGKIESGLPIEAKPSGNIKPIYNTKAQNGPIARDTFRTLLSRFDDEKTYKDLVKDYGAPNAQRIQDTVDQAKVLEPWIGTTTDAKNRGDIRYQFMSFLVKATGSIPGLSYWFAMVLLAVIVKIIISPLTKAQFKSMKEMQKIQPLMKELQEKYKGNQQEQGAKMMELYKEHGINPLSGCLPILIQMPILFGVYSMIRLFEYQFTAGKFLWIGFSPFVHKLSMPLVGGKVVWFTARNLAEPDLILLVLYTISMFVSSRISIVDPTQAEQQKMMSIMMPLMFFFLIGYLPAAFIFYWFVFNVLQTWQQYHIIHGGTPAEEPVAPKPSTEEIQPRRSGRRRRRH